MEEALWNLRPILIVIALLLGRSLSGTFFSRLSPDSLWLGNKLTRPLTGRNTVLSGGLLASGADTSQNSNL